jgi:hypothetical protein
MGSVTAGRIALIVLGSIGVLFGVAVLAGGVFCSGPTGRSVRTAT